MVLRKISGEWQVKMLCSCQPTTLTKITNQHMWKSTYESTACQTLKRMGYSSRRSHWLPLMSDKNKKLRLQFTQTPKLDNRRKRWLVWWVFCCDSQMVGIIEPSWWLLLTIPLWPPCIHLLMAAFSRTKQNVSKLIWSKTGFSNMTVCSQY